MYIILIISIIKARNCIIPDRFINDFWLAVSTKRLLAVSTKRYLGEDLCCSFVINMESFLPFLYIN